MGFEEGVLGLDRRRPRVRRDEARAVGPRATAVSRASEPPPTAPPHGRPSHLRSSPAGRGRRPGSRDRGRGRARRGRSRRGPTRPEPLAPKATGLPLRSATVRYSVSPRTTNMPGVPYIAAMMRRFAGGRPTPLSASCATSPCASRSQHPRQHRERADARVPASSTSGCAGEVAHEALSGVGRPPANLRIIAAMYGTPGMFVVRGTRCTAPSPILKGKPVAFAPAARASSSSPATSSTARPRPRSRLPGRLPRPGRRWTEDGDGRPCGGAVGRRHRMARLHGRRPRPPRRALHRAGRGGPPAIQAKHPSSSQTIPAVLIPARTRPSHRWARGASSSPPPPCPKTSRIGWRRRFTGARLICPAPAAGARNHRSQTPRPPPPARADPPGRPPLLARNRRHR